ncbi:MoeA N-terminal and linker domain [Trinorchestia longiramus]|nr:MoeA N-terminal and linker domain [Trinorchestia longiramus]
MIPELRNLSYERRLQRLELISLEQRRLRGQLIETFKYLNGLNNVTMEGLFERDDKKTFSVDPLANKQNECIVNFGQISELRNVSATKHPVSVMMLGVVASNGEKMPPVWFPRGYRLNASAYKDVIVTKILPGVEDTELVKSSDDGRVEIEIRILKAPEVGLDIRPLGCDIAAGELVLPEGIYLGAAEVGLAASVGLARVKVLPKPLVGVLSTGNEVQAADGRPLASGCIFDSNSPTLVSLLRLQHFPCVTARSARDAPDHLKTSIAQLLDQGVDVLVTSGGVSMGDKDILRPVLQADFNATIHFAQVFMKPGKPTTFASFDYEGRRRLVLGLPGNPVSATVTANLYLLPLCRAIAGVPDFRYTQLRVKLEHNISLDPRPEYHRATLTFPSSSDLPVAFSTGSQMSSRLLSLANARALLVLPPRSDSRPSLHAGEVVSAILL